MRPTKPRNPTPLALPGRLMPRNPTPLALPVRPTPRAMPCNPTPRASAVRPTPRARRLPTPRVVAPTPRAFAPTPRAFPIVASTLGFVRIGDIKTEIISRQEDADGVTRYSILVSGPCGSHVVFRRYREFDELHRELWGKDGESDAQAAVMPPKNLFKSIFCPKFQAEREECLSKVATAAVSAVADVKLQDCPPCLVRFLGLDEQVSEAHLVEAIGKPRLQQDSFLGDLSTCSSFLKEDTNEDFSECSSSCGSFVMTYCAESSPQRADAEVYLPVISLPAHNSTGEAVSTRTPGSETAKAVLRKLSPPCIKISRQASTNSRELGIDGFWLHEGFSVAEVTDSHVRWLADEFITPLTHLSCNEWSVEMDGNNFQVKSHRERDKVQLVWSDGVIWSRTVNSASTSAVTTPRCIATPRCIVDPRSGCSQEIDEGSTEEADEDDEADEDEEENETIEGRALQALKVKLLEEYSKLSTNLDTHIEEIKDVKEKVSVNDVKEKDPSDMTFAEKRALFVSMNKSSSSKSLR